jgi:hypothetical protein
LLQVQGCFEKDCPKNWGEYSRLVEHGWPLEALVFNPAQKVSSPIFELSSYSFAQDKSA